ncbi:MAG: hypothetical protein IJW64_03710 [Clostridia bacterium]|nr:hypothetical protein [Clostridia bacterium]
MKKWIKFKFKDPLWLYALIIWGACGLLFFLTVKESEYFLSAIAIIIGAIASVGLWFGNHYGIRISGEKYLIICNTKIGSFSKDEVSQITFYFVKNEENKYDVLAKVFCLKKPPKEFVWHNVYSHRFGGTLNLNVKKGDLQELTENLCEDKKITVKVIDNA